MSSSGWRQNGQALILFALAIAALIGIVAMALDLGYTYVSERRLQNAADAAAIAGARQVGLGAPFNAEPEAVRYAQYNGVADPDGDPDDGVNGNVAVQFIDQNSQVVTPTMAVGISVTVRGSVPALLASLNFTQAILVSARATAMAGVPAGQDGILSFAVCEADWQLGGTYGLWGPQYRNSCTGTPANFKGIIDYNNRLDQNGTPYPSSPDQPYDWYIAYGYPNTVWKGDQIAIVGGSQGQNAATALLTYINNHALTDAGGTYANVVLPIFRDYVASGPGRIIVKGFAVFKIYAADVSSNAANGRFVSAIKSGSYLSFGSPDYGAKVVKLTQ